VNCVTYRVYFIIIRIECTEIDGQMYVCLATTPHLKVVVVVSAS